MNKLQVCVMHRHGPAASCGARGADEVWDALRSMVADSDVSVSIEAVNCLLYCQKGPNVRVLPAGKIWHDVNREKCLEIVQWMGRSI